MSARELESQFLERNIAALRWDNEPSNTALAELSEAKIRRFVERAGLPWGYDPHNATNATNAAQITQTLTKLDLLQGGQLVNAARLFFAYQPIQLRCAVFPGTTSATILDRHDFDVDVLELIEEAEKYILKNIHFGTRLEGLRWVEVPEISRAALREAVINAFCHRDWRDPDYIQIAIYKNRVEICNPGGLFDGLSFEAMRRGNVSHRRSRAKRPTAGKRSPVFTALAHPPSVHRAALRLQPGVGQAQPQGGAVGFFDQGAVVVGGAGHAVNAAKAKDAPVA